MNSRHLTTEARRLAKTAFALTPAVTAYRHNGFLRTINNNGAPACTPDSAFPGVFCNMADLSKDSDGDQIWDCQALGLTSIEVDYFESFMAAIQAQRPLSALDLRNNNFYDDQLTKVINDASSNVGSSLFADDSLNLNLSGGGMDKLKPYNEDIWSTTIGSVLVIDFNCIAGRGLIGTSEDDTFADFSNCGLTDADIYALMFFLLANYPDSGKTIDLNGNADPSRATNQLIDQLEANGWTVILSGRRYA